jgi:hypothetical protein
MTQWLLLSNPACLCCITVYCPDNDFNTHFGSLFFSVFYASISVLLKEAVCVRQISRQAKNKHFFLLFHPYLSSLPTTEDLCCTVACSILLITTGSSSIICCLIAALLGYFRLTYPITIVVLITPYSKITRMLLCFVIFSHKVGNLYSFNKLWYFYCLLLGLFGIWTKVRESNPPPWAKPYHLPQTLLSLYF